MALKPKNVQEDSWSYTLPHEVGFLIQELAEQEAKELHLTRLSTSDFLERTIRQLAEQKLTEDQRHLARQRHEQRTQERVRRAREREAQQEEGSATRVS